MDFEPSDTQRALLDALDALLRRHAGPARSRELAVRGEYDHALDARLRAGGPFELFADADAGPLEAALAGRASSPRSSARAARCRTCWLLPALGASPPRPTARSCWPSATTRGRCGTAPRPAARCWSGPTGAPPRNFVPDDATLCRAPPTATPLARVSPAGTTDLDLGTAAAAANWWRVGVSAEAVGMMRKALDLTVQYAKDRTVFRRPIGPSRRSTHRLAELSVHVEGARWLTYEAADHGAPAEASAVAAAQYDGRGAPPDPWETHQIMGAVGLTREHEPAPVDAPASRQLAAEGRRRAARAPAGRDGVAVGSGGREHPRGVHFCRGQSRPGRGRQEVRRHYCAAEAHL
ncbi:acyl-CoA dehydrogenase family protein [Yinghuangia aomiensis]